MTTTDKKPDTLASAMALAFAAIEGATKAAAGQVGQQKYKYADLTSVIDAIKPALVANGLFFTQEPRVNGGGVEIETVLHHRGGETYSMGCLFVPAANNNAQGFGSALTYARRYALVTAFGVPVEDDDGKAASAPAPKPEPKAAAEPLITPSQLTELQMMFTHLAVPVQEFLDFAKIKDLRKVRAESFDKAKAWINDRAKAMRETNKPADDLDGDNIPY